MKTPARSVASQVATDSRRRFWPLAGLLAAGSIALVWSLGAWAGGGHHHGHGMHGMHGATASSPMGGMAGMGGMPWGGRHLERMLDKVDATAAQREQIRKVADQAQADMAKLHEEGRTLHEQGLKLWAQPKIDATAAEKLRKQMLAHHDKCSKRMLQATIDVGNVLTPEQRAKVAEYMQKRHDKHRARMMEGRSASQPAKE